MGQSLPLGTPHYPANSYNPMRVIPAGGGEARCEVVFTLRRRAGVSDAEFEADAAAVAADLETLRGLLAG